MTPVLKLRLFLVGFALAISLNIVPQLYHWTIYFSRYFEVPRHYTPPSEQMIYMGAVASVATLLILAIPTALAWVFLPGRFYEFYFKLLGRPQRVSKARRKEYNIVLRSHLMTFWRWLTFFNFILVGIILYVKIFVFWLPALVRHYF
jgi:hypothetical protein